MNRVWCQKRQLRQYAPRQAPFVPTGRSSVLRAVATCLWYPIADDEVGACVDSWVDVSICHILTVCLIAHSVVLS
jgi:hypothetical protein